VVDFAHTCVRADDDTGSRDASVLPPADAGGDVNLDGGDVSLDGGAGSADAAADGGP
jgi:hypothetical protein